MSTKRTPIHRSARARITPDLVEVWLRLRDFTKRERDEWEPIGRRGEYLDGMRALHTRLGLKPWEESPLYAVRQAPPDYLRGNELQLEGWRKAWEYRGALEAAATALKA